MIGDLVSVRSTFVPDLNVHVHNNLEASENLLSHEKRSE